MKEQKKILIIDDDSRNIFALNAVLRSKNFDCDFASGANEGLRKIEENNYGVILMDIMMPDMDGFEALEYMQKHQLDHVPVIAVTAQAMPGDKEKCLNAGAAGYISKPVKIDELTRLIDQLMKENA